MPVASAAGSASAGTKSEPWGLFGGGSASPSRFYLEPDGDARELSSKSTTELDVGDVVSVQTPGGGGYGPPTEREPDAVLADVRDGKVSIEAAREAYGLEVDLEAGTAEPTAAREGSDTGEPRPDGGERTAGDGTEGSTGGDGE